MWIISPGGGILAYIDVETGVVCSPASDKAGKEYLFHPDSHKQIIGYRIPGWENYKNFALRLAGKYPTMRYVGWDIIMDAEGQYVVIEGNKDAGAQMESKLLYGLLPYYNKILKMGEA